MPWGRLNIPYIVLLCLQEIWRRTISIRNFFWQSIKKIWFKFRLTLVIVVLTDTGLGFGATLAVFGGLFSRKGLFSGRPKFFGRYCSKSVPETFNRMSWVFVVFCDNCKVKVLRLQTCIEVPTFYLFSIKYSCSIRKKYTGRLFNHHLSFFLDIRYYSKILVGKMIKRKETRGCRVTEGLVGTNN